MDDDESVSYLGCGLTVASILNLFSFRMIMHPALVLRRPPMMQSMPSADVELLTARVSCSNDCFMDHWVLVTGIL